MVIELQAFLLLPSWSVSYLGEVYDDARTIKRVWYYRDVIDRQIYAFEEQDRVVVLRGHPVMS